MKNLLISFSLTFIVTAASESCGNLQPINGQWPWSVSIFAQKSNIAFCQGSIISNKHILTAGHCLQNANLSDLTVYPGLIYHRPGNEQKAVWQVEQINLHPRMKLTPSGRIFNGGFIASMEINADVAIATLKQAIQFDDKITSVCLSSDISIESTDIHGSYSGWNVNKKEIESINVTVNKIGESELFEIVDDSQRVDLKSGTGFYSNINSSWVAIGLKTKDNQENGTIIHKFVNIYKYADWIKNFCQASVSDKSPSTSTNNSTSSKDSQATKDLVTSSGNPPMPISSTTEMSKAAQSPPSTELKSSSRSVQVSTSTSTVSPQKPMTASSQIEMSEKTTTNVPIQKVEEAINTSISPGNYFVNSTKVSLSDSAKALINATDNLLNSNPQGRNLRDFGNNLTEATQNATIAVNGIFGAILPTLLTMSTTTAPNMNNSIEINGKNVTIVNSTVTDGNATHSAGEAHELLAGLNVSPIIVISSTVVICLLMLIVVFSALACSGKK